jgi:hypothetical protein
MNKTNLFIGPEFLIIAAVVGLAIKSLAGLFH